MIILPSRCLRKLDHYNQSLLFTAAGTYFKTADLTYQGNFGLGNVLSMSHSATAQEAVLLLGVSNSYSTTTYPSVLKRFTGSLLIASTDIALPLIGGQQTYGMAVFHAADDTHVLVVQTGTSTAGGSGAQYYLLDR